MVSVVSIALEHLGTNVEHGQLEHLDFPWDLRFYWGNLKLKLLAERLIRHKGREEITNGDLQIQPHRDGRRRHTSARTQLSMDFFCFGPNCGIQLFFVLFLNDFECILLGQL